MHDWTGSLGRKLRLFLYCHKYRKTRRVFELLGATMYRLIFAAVIAFLPVAANAQPTSAPPATSTPEARIAIPPGWYLVPTTLLNRVFTLVQMDGGAASTLLGNDIGACIRAASGSRITM